MIPFLVKLANLLDDRGQHSMAREVDGLIEKLAQIVEDPSSSKEMSQMFDEMNPNIRGIKKAPQKPGDLIRLIQNAIGAPASGKWDPTTNTKFINYMNANLPLAMQDNKFVGLVIDDKGTRSSNKLADAWELIKEQTGAGAELAQDEAQKPADQASKAPAAKPAAAPLSLRSKYFKITPELQALLSQWEAARGAGQAQTLLDAFDRSPGQTQQSLEEFIKENMNA